MAECELYQEERDVLQGEMRDLNKSGMKSFDALDSREKTIAILGDRWWPQTAKQEGIDKLKASYVILVHRNNVMSAQYIGGVSLLGVGTVLRPYRKGFVIVGELTPASNE